MRRSTIFRITRFIKRLAARAMRKIRSTFAGLATSQSAKRAADRLPVRSNTQSHTSPEASPQGFATVSAPQKEKTAVASICCLETTRLAGAVQRGGGGGGPPPRCDKG